MPIVVRPGKSSTAVVEAVMKVVAGMPSVVEAVVAEAVGIAGAVYRTILDPGASLASMTPALTPDSLRRCTLSVVLSAGVRSSDRFPALAGSMS